VKEDLLHFIWKYKKLQLQNLVTSAGESLTIIDVGTHNHLAGPDFLYSKVEIAGQLWAGNVEIHLKSSDWYAHNHEQDPNYSNVILHIVWEDDAKVFRSDNSQIPTLELKNVIPPTMLNAYRQLFDKRQKSFINCENDISKIDDFTIQNWLERLYFERLERKSSGVEAFLVQYKNDWEKVLFIMLMKNFGLNINGAAFLSLAKVLDFSIVRKLQSNLLHLESVFYGMSHLLEADSVLDKYYMQLQTEFQHQKNKFSLEEQAVQKPDFFKLRPPNFPTIRLSQLANLYVRHQNLFEKVIRTSNVTDLYSIFEITASSYWDTHFTFGTVSKKSTKKLTKKFIDLLLINTILPIKFLYARQHGKEIEEEILTIISQLKTETNSVISKFKHLGVHVVNAKDSQAIVQLYTEYCTKNRCLKCAVGSNLLKK